MRKERKTRYLDSIEQYKYDDFSEIYLLYDYDAHSNNLPKELDSDSVLKQMLLMFDNETENGKLLVSYPMIEACRDYENVGTLYSYDRTIGRKYKEIVTNRNNKRFKTLKDWEKSLLQYCLANSYLHNRTLLLREISQLCPVQIFEKEMAYASSNRIISLSGLIEFLVEYYPSDKLCGLFGFTTEEFSYKINELFDGLVVISEQTNQQS